MDMTPYDPAEVRRMRTHPNRHDATMQFAMHVEKVSPTHVWPYMFFAKHALSTDERIYYLNQAIKAWDRQAQAEQEGSATRRRDKCEKTLFRNALYLMAQQMAVLGEPSEAASAVARLLEVDPKDRLKAMGMLRLYGVFPAQDTETAIAVRM